MCLTRAGGPGGADPCLRRPGSSPPSQDKPLTGAVPGRLLRSPEATTLRNLILRACSIRTLGAACSATKGGMVGPYVRTCSSTGRVGDGVAAQSASSASTRGSLATAAASPSPPEPSRFDRGLRPHAVAQSRNSANVVLEQLRFCAYATASSTIIDGDHMQQSCCSSPPACSAFRRCSEIYPLSCDCVWDNIRFRAPLGSTPCASLR